MNRRICLLMLLSAFAGCASAPVAPGCVPMGRTGQVCLLEPAALRAARAAHIVEIHRNGREDVFVGQLQINAHALRLAGTSLFGTTLFSILYDGHSIQVQPPQADVHADMLLAMLELSLADPAVLRDRLHNLRLEVKAAQNAQVRELFEHGRLIARIRRSDAPLAEAQINIEIPADDMYLHMTPVPASMPHP
jgi:Protein of unknown function (DUF3261)